MGARRRASARLKNVPCRANAEAKELRDWLGRPRIYMTECFRSRYETLARANLQHALRRMTGGLLVGGVA